MPTNSKLHVYICSAGHSGSTLLDMMLGTHPECESLGELSLLPMDMAMSHVCGCGLPYTACELWAPILSEFSREKGIDAFADPYAVNLGYMQGMVVDRKKINARYKLHWYPLVAMKYAQMRYGLSFLSHFTGQYDEGTRNTLDLYDRVLRHTGKSVTIDSTKRYFKAAALYEARPANTRLVVLVRDGRGVFYSGLKRGFSKSYSLKAWLNYYSRALPLFKSTVRPEHVHAVRYEELARNPKEVLKGVCQFMGIEFDERMLNFRSVVHHNVNGNDMKFSSTSELRLDEAWKAKLSARDLGFFQRRAGALNGELGYE